jgi:hypothetical protein
VAERDIRKALKKRVEAYGGEIRAVSWLGRAHAPDVLCLFPGGRDLSEGHPFIETKAPGGKPNAGQLREHKRMREAGCIVLVISTLGQLDSWLPPPP